MAIRLGKFFSISSEGAFYLHTRHTFVLITSLRQREICKKDEIK